MSDVDTEAAARVGAVLNDKWTLERLLGVGGMGAVYAARHRNGARAAVKVLHPELAKVKEVRERFRREGYAANKVEHPGVVKVLDDDILATSSGSSAELGTPYLVMELLDGESLQDRLERGESMGEREFLEMAERVLDVLEAAHAAGVVHRDLKPENLFFARGEDGVERLKVLDFGLARLPQGQAITSYGLALGTPSFMSPEQAAGRIDEIDGRTDLFALATTGFRLRAGRRIHEAADAVELVRKMAKEPAPRLRSVAPGASEPYARVIDRALEFRRDDRYESAAAMRADVKRALAELSQVALAETQVSHAAPPPLRAPAAEPTGEISGRDIEAVVQPPPLRAPSAEPTTEISGGDLETSEPIPLAAKKASKQAPGMDESVHIPKRTPWLLWFALLVCGAIGVKVWLDRRAAGDATAGTAPSASAADTSAAADAAVHADAGPPKVRPPASRRPVQPKTAPSGSR